jgi:hypothetical protein
MQNFDVFNGDADGICALVQLRLAHPQTSELITGVKRDINLLDRVSVDAGDKVTVLDISMQKNHVDVHRILNAGGHVFYVDHHNAGEPIAHLNLSQIIDTSPEQCTSLLVDAHLSGQYHLWAITAAYGDNLTLVADKLSQQSGLTEAQSNTLKSLGIYINYNGYGAGIEDLYFHPADLYQHCVRYSSPLDFVTDAKDVFETLSTGYTEDLQKAFEQPYTHETADIAAIILPDAKWARRVSGVFSNDLSNRYPDRAHVILTQKTTGDYVVSIRAPQSRLEGADEVAMQFATGGGRKGAAGINSLSDSSIPALIDAMAKRYS